MNTRLRREMLRNAAQRASGSATYQRAPARTQGFPHGVMPSDPLRDARASAGGRHPLTDRARNAELFQYEQEVKGKFGRIVAVLKEIAAIQHESDFVSRAQSIAQSKLGFALPQETLEDAWVEQLDMRALYAYCVFETFQQTVNHFIDEANRREEEAELALRAFLDCGYHEVDISPCADGRLKGLLQFILRVPLNAVRSRKAHAGAMFDVEANVRHWQRTEFSRYREGKPSLPESGTRFLKVAVYHFSTSDPLHEGCAAHGSNDKVAAEAALTRLVAFREAIENSFCCGASVDILLIGVDTDTDSIKIHVPDSQGNMSLHRFVDSAEVFRETLGLDENAARLAVYRKVDEAASVTGWGQGHGAPHEGMKRLVINLLINNLSQIDYVIEHYNGRYPDIGHNERFISVGEGFEEIQIRNLSYFAHMFTVEEGAADIDVGIKIFKGLNVRHGLPIPIVIHYRYNSRVPGSRERIVEQCQRVKKAIEARFSDLVERGVLYCAMAVKDREPGSKIEMIPEQREAAGH